MVALRMAGALSGVDATRFLAAGRAFPSAVQPFWARVVALAVPPAKSAAPAAGR
jgi:hypothetical protein